MAGSFPAREEGSVLSLGTVAIRTRCCGSWSKRSRPSRTSLTGHELSVEMPDATTASDWLPTFEFGLANDSSCLKRPVRVSGAEGRFTLKLDARQSSSRWQPPALNVDRPTAAFEASELSLSTRPVVAIFRSIGRCT